MQSYLLKIILRSLTYLSILLIFIPFTSQALDKNSETTKPQWEVYKNEDGVTGYEREVKDSKYIETRAETVINAPIENILEVIKDTPSYPSWMYKCKEAVELQNNNNNSRLLYIVQGSPLGSPDRDVVILANSIANWEMGSYIISLNSKNHDVTEYLDGETDQNRQRMTEFRGKWEFRMLDRNNTKVIYNVFTDPGGFAPGFMVNSMMRKVSFFSVKEMIPMAKDKQYADAAGQSQTKKLIEAKWKNIPQ
jgi:uncharacterized membrane protein